MKLRFAAILGAALMAAVQSQAGYITYTSADRTAGLGDATDVIVGTGNASANVINSSSFGTGNPADPWVERGSVEGGQAGPGTISNGDLTVTLLTGNWGAGGPLTGKWTINNPNFWTLYGYAAISMHVGNGQGDPDHWIWRITKDEMTGNFDYEDFDGRGGGLSNLKLYSHGTGDNNVPDGGLTAMLLGLGLSGLGASRRFLKK